MKYTEEEIKSIYDKSSSAPPLLSWHAEEFLTRMRIYREKAIASLDLTNNSVVLDVACGIGFNFRVLEKYLGNNGKIIGVELSHKTVRLAEKLIEMQKWTNREIVNRCILDYEPGFLFDAIICTLAMEIMHNQTTLLETAK